MSSRKNKTLQKKQGLRARDFWKAGADKAAELICDIVDKDSSGAELSHEEAAVMFSNIALANLVDQCFPKVDIAPTGPHTVRWQHQGECYELDWRSSYTTAWSPVLFVCTTRTFHVPKTLRERVEKEDARFGSKIDVVYNEGDLFVVKIFEGYNVSPARIYNVLNKYIALSIKEINWRATRIQGWLDGLLRAEDAFPVSASRNGGDGHA